MIKWDDGISASVFVTQGKAFIKLRSEKRPKLIGFMGGHRGNVLIMQRSEERHMMQRIRGYGFNVCLLEKFLIPKGLSVGLEIDGKYKYALDPKLIMEHGSYLHFKNQGFELQIFLSLENIEQLAFYKWVKPEEENLFGEKL